MNLNNHSSKKENATVKLLGVINQLEQISAIAEQLGTGKPLEWKNADGSHSHTATAEESFNCLAELAMLAQADLMTLQDQFTALASGVQLTPVVDVKRQELS